MDKLLEFPDGTRWFYARTIDVWIGSRPGEEGGWFHPDHEFRKLYDVNEGWEVDNE